MHLSVFLLFISIFLKNSCSLPLRGSVKTTTSDYGRRGDEIIKEASKHIAQTMSSCRNQAQLSSIINEAYRVFQQDYKKLLTRIVERISGHYKVIMAYASNPKQKKLYVVGEGDIAEFSFSTLTRTAGCIQVLDDAKGDYVYLMTKPL